MRLNPNKTERPISFNAPMLEALLGGTKTETRRPMKKQPSPEDMPESISWNEHNGVVQSHHDGAIYKSEYGKPGHTLWVREVWRTSDCWDSVPLADIGSNAPTNYLVDGASYGGNSGWGKWRSARTMPRWASRIQLRITDIHCERLSDITEESAIAEGFDSLMDFARMWNSIYCGKGFGWKEDPWVWVLKFEMVREGEGER